MAKKKVKVSNGGDFVQVIAISLVYCLVQIPNINPQSFQHTKVTYNRTDDEVDVAVHIPGDIISVFIYYLSVAVVSISAAFVKANLDYMLLLFSAVSTSRAIIGATGYKLYDYLIAAVSGAGFGGSFVTTAIYIVLLSDNKKTARNFSFFAACCGASYFLYAGLLNITRACTSGPCRTTPLVAALIGIIIMVLFIVRRNLAEAQKWKSYEHVPFSSDSLDFIKGTLLYKQHIDVWSKVEAGVAVLFYSYSINVIGVLYTHCMLLIGSYKYHAEAVIPYGIGYMLASLQWSYYYKEWRSPVRTVISTVLLVTALIVALIFRDSACTTPQLLESWYMVPIVGLLIGQSLGSIACETFTVINIAWTTRFKFTVLLLVEIAWTLCLFMLYYKLNVVIYIVLLSILGLMYCASIMNFQRRAQRFSERMDNYMSKSSYNYGSV